MTTTSQIPAVTDWLVNAAENAAALSGVSVFDGPQVPAAKHPAIVPEKPHDEQQN